MTALRDQALSLLLYESALAQEAERLGVQATTADARRRLAHAREQVVGKEVSTRLDRARIERSLVEQVRLQLLAEKVREQVRENGESGNITQGLLNRWGARIACRPGNSVASCGDP